jgi:hypothetical protein
VIMMAQHRRYPFQQHPALTCKYHSQHPETTEISQFNIPYLRYTSQNPYPTHIAQILHEHEWQDVLCARRNIVNTPLLYPACAHDLELIPDVGHVFGKPTKREATYDNLHISRNAWDTNLVKVGRGYLDSHPVC